VKRNLLSLFILLSTTVSYGQTIEVKFTKGASKALNLVATLPEVVNASNYVEKVSKGKRHLRTRLESDPTKDEPYYRITVVEDNGITDYVHFTFLVEPKTFAIQYEDTVTADNKLIPEKKCRKRLMDAYHIK
jgi:hypothetical protein